MHRLFNKRDALLCVLLFTAALLAFLAVSLSASEGEYVEITKDGELLATLPLKADVTYPIGEGNCLRIEGGEVWMQSADCLGQHCVRHRKIARGGERIVCLPNRVIVQIRGGEEGADAFGG